MRIITSLVLALCVVGNGWADAITDLTPLTDDPSRAELARMAAQEVEPGTKGFGPRFDFPEKAERNYTYGIDISHHNFTGGKSLNWLLLPNNKISFVIMKATQGSRFVDPTLRKNWSDALAARDKRVPTLIGTYHFLSADVDAAEQARTYVSVMKALGFERTRDLPPTLDLEWDGKPDRWKAFSPSEILSKVKTWTSIVKSELGVAPLLYTNAQWWKQVNLGSVQFENDLRIWIADYTQRANSSFVPATPPNKRWMIWQFTDSARVGGHEFDANVFLNDRVSLAQEFDLREGI